MKILVINSGSSSIKCELYGTISQEDLFHHIVEEVVDHAIALDQLIQKLLQSNIIETLDEVDAFAHRVVHGGDLFSQSVIINDEILKQLDTIEHLAPLHNPHNIAAIKYFQKKFPAKTQIAVFDTAFHQTLSKEAFLYPLPYELYEKEHIRKYGFHGSSHAFLVQQAAKTLDKDNKDINCITLHLGNGASVCAVQNGKSIDTSMGFTPLQGLMMGTRCGDIDPSIVIYLQNQLDLSVEEIERLLNKKSGLKGICNCSDMRQVIHYANNGNDLAQLALEMFVYSIVKYIGSYHVILGKIDAIIFSGGIGEHSWEIRKMVCDKISTALGIIIDEQANKSHQTILSTKKSAVKVFNIATNEELYIALEAKRLLT